MVVRSLEPNSHYTFRLDVANEVGWSRKSEPFACHTVCRPDTPQLREGQHQVPYLARPLGTCLYFPLLGFRRKIYSRIVFVLEGFKGHPRYELRICWDQRDPLGGAISESEAQICESSLFTLFSGWAAPKDFLLLRQPTLHDMVS